MWGAPKVGFYMVDVRLRLGFYMVDVHLRLGFYMVDVHLRLGFYMVDVHLRFKTAFKMPPVLMFCMFMSPKTYDDA
jgi:hypothetical protein